jgi:hypothetical protein
MSRTTRAIAASAALLFSLHMVSLHGAQKSPKPAPAPHAAKTTTAKPQTTKPAASKTVAAGHKVTKQSASTATASKAAAPKGTAKPAPKLAKQRADKTKPAATPAATKAAKKDAASLKKAAVTKKTDVTKKTASTKKADATKKKTEAAQTAATTPTIPLENLSPVQQKLAKNTNLASKLQSRLPAGTNLMEAADGFRNLGQFVAAVNVSNNLQIPFENLKTDMVTKKMSLGQSIQDLRPITGSPTIEAQHAEYEANSLITQTEQETSVTLSTKVTTTTATTPTTSTTSSAKPRKSGHKSLTGGL